MARWEVKSLFVLVCVASWAILIGPIATVGWWLLGRDTEYAPKFSERRFEDIHPGMSVQEVEALLGPPLEIASYPGGCFVGVYEVEDGRRSHLRPPLTYICPVPGPDRETYFYTRPGGAASYYVRDVEFTGGQVTSIRASLYSD